MNKKNEFLFTVNNLKKVEKIISRYPKGRQASAVMPLLDLAQRQNDNWLPKEAIEYVAKILGMEPIRVYEVATFYTMYNLRPIGKFHVQVCTNLPCWLRGANKISNACAKFLGIQPGNTSHDGNFTLSNVECLGACVNAPMIQINDSYFEDLDPQLTERILIGLKKKTKVKTGSQINRHTCEPIGGLTSIKHQDPLRKKILRN